jgi:hypothetical protein
VDVEDASAKFIDEFAGEQTHVSGKANQIDLVFAKRGGNLAIMICTAPASAFDYKCLQAPFASSLKSGRIRLIANYQGHFSIRNSSRTNGISQRDHV